MIGDTYYRYENPYTSCVVVLRTFTVERETPCGVWIREVAGIFRDDKAHFVLNDARKRFAHPDKEAARVSFVSRKTRQIGFLRAQAMNAETAIRSMGGTPPAINKDGDQ